jgi:hypothetical protein
MRKPVTTALFLMLMLGADAMAQTKRQEPLPAPIGHRQPRADEIPQGKDNSAASEAEKRQDAELDRKIKSICRGC